MGYRRQARELAMQALFYLDMRKIMTLEAFEFYCRHFPPPYKSEPFFTELVTGVIHIRPEIDGVIERFSSNWKISRMSCVDRNIIRIAAFELIYCSDIPAKVSINEAIDVGKKFGTEESGAFINGILDGIRVALEKGEIEQRMLPFNQHQGEDYGK